MTRGNYSCLARLHRLVLFHVAAKAGLAYSVRIKSMLYKIQNQKINTKSKLRDYDCTCITAKPPMLFLLSTDSTITNRCVLFRCLAPSRSTFCSMRWCAAADPMRCVAFSSSRIQTTGGFWWTRSLCGRYDRWRCLHMTEVCDWLLT